MSSNKSSEGSLQHMNVEDWRNTHLANVCRLDISGTVCSCVVSSGPKSSQFWNYQHISMALKNLQHGLGLVGQYVCPRGMQQRKGWNLFQQHLWERVCKASKGNWAPARGCKKAGASANQRMSEKKPFILRILDFRDVVCPLEVGVAPKKMTETLLSAKWGQTPLKTSHLLYPSMLRKIINVKPSRLSITINSCRGGCQWSYSEAFGSGGAGGASQSSASTGSGANSAPNGSSGTAGGSEGTSSGSGGSSSKRAVPAAGVARKGFSEEQQLQIQTEDHSVAERHGINRYDHDPRERSSGEMFRWHRRRTQRNSGVIIVL